MAGIGYAATDLVRTFFVTPGNSEEPKPLTLLRQGPQYTFLAPPRSPSDHGQGTVLAQVSGGRSGGRALWAMGFQEWNEGRGTEQGERATQRGLWAGDGLTLVSQGPLKHELPIEAPLPHQEPNFWTHSRVGQPDCGLPIPRKDPYCWAESRSPEKGADVRC